MQLNPSELFPITYSVDDPSDTQADSYYIRAVIKKLIDNSTLATVDLTNIGSGVYKYNWRVLSLIDVWIAITVTVYTDSGYTTLAPNYARVTNEHLIVERLYPYQLGGSSTGIDYEKIKKLIEETLKNKKIEFPKYPELKEIETLIRLEIERYIGELKNSIDSIQIPLPIIPQKIDLTSLESGLIEVKKQIGKIEIPKPEKVKLDGVIEMIENLSSDFKVYFSEHGRSHQNMEKVIIDLQEVLKETNFKVTLMPIKPEEKMNNEQILKRLKAKYA